MFSFILTEVAVFSSHISIPVILDAVAAVVASSLPLCLLNTYENFVEAQKHFTKER